MASDSEASCVSDPNFAVICSFLQKFGALCGITSPDFLELQEMLENSQELPQELIDIHLKLLRRIKKSVSADRWERVLIKVCHTYCSQQDAWELERFGYKNAMLPSKLRILKTLLEMQFDFHQKFKTEVNNLTPNELRLDPIGRDKHGHSYWYQVDDACQVRVYREDPDEETWVLVANDREGLVRLISQLTSDDPSLAELALNEDSNSLEIEKPILDTGQASSSTSNAEAEAEESSGGNEDSKDVSSEAQTETSPLETPTEIPVTENTAPAEEDPKTEERPKLKIKIGSPDTKLNNTEEKALEQTENTETKIEECIKKDNTKELVGIDLSVPQTSAQAAKRIGPSKKRKKSINDLAANLIMKTRDMVYKNPVQEQEMDLSVKKPRMDPKQFSSLSVPPFEPMSIESALRMSTDFADEDEENEDELFDEDEITLPSHMKQPRLDRPTLLGNTKKKSYSDEEEEYGEEIEEPVMLIKGDGSGKDCETGNIPLEEDYSEAVEEPIMYFFGNGSGQDCDTGNPGKEEETNTSSDLQDATSSKVNEDKQDSDSASNNKNFVLKTDCVDSSENTYSDSVNKPHKIGTIMIDVKSGEKGETSDAVQLKRRSRWDIGKPVGSINKINDSEEKEVCDDSTNSSIKNNESSEIKLQISQDETDKAVNDIIITDVNESNEFQKLDESKDVDGDQVELETEDNTSVNVEKALIDCKTDDSETVNKDGPEKPKFFFGPGCFQFKAAASKPEDEAKLGEDKTDQENNLCTDNDDVPTCINKANNLEDNKEQTTILQTNLSLETESTSDDTKTDNIEKLSDESNVAKVEDISELSHINVKSSSDTDSLPTVSSDKNQSEKISTVESVPDNPKNEDTNHEITVESVESRLEYLFSDQKSPEIDLQVNTEHDKTKNLATNEKLDITIPAQECTKDENLATEIEKEIVVNKIESGVKLKTDLQNDIPSDIKTSPTDQNKFIEIENNPETNINEDIMDDKSETLSETLESLSTLIENKCDESDEQETKNSTQQSDDNFISDYGDIAKTNLKSASANVIQPSEDISDLDDPVLDVDDEFGISEPSANQSLEIDVEQTEVKPVEDNLVPETSDDIEIIRNPEVEEKSVEALRTNNSIENKANIPSKCVEDNNEAVSSSNTENVANVSSINEENMPETISSVTIENSEISSTVNIEENVQTKFSDITEEKNLPVLQENSVTSEDKFSSETENNFCQSSEATVPNAVSVAENIASEDQPVVGKNMSEESDLLAVQENKITSEDDDLNTEDIAQVSDSKTSDETLSSFDENIIKEQESVENIDPKVSVENSDDSDEKLTEISDSTDLDVAVRKNECKLIENTPIIPEPSLVLNIDVSANESELKTTEANEETIDTGGGSESAKMDSINEMDILSVDKATKVAEIEIEDNIGAQKFKAKSIENEYEEMTQLNIHEDNGELESISEDEQLEIVESKKEPFLVTSDEDKITEEDLAKTEELNTFTVSSELDPVEVNDSGNLETNQSSIDLSEEKMSVDKPAMVMKIGDERTIIESGSQDQSLETTPMESEEIESTQSADDNKIATRTEETNTLQEESLKSLIDEDVNMSEQTTEETQVLKEESSIPLNIETEEIHSSGDKILVDGTTAKKTINDTQSLELFASPNKEATTNIEESTDLLNKKTVDEVITEGYNVNSVLEEELPESSVSKEETEEEINDVIIPPSDEENDIDDLKAQDESVASLNIKEYSLKPPNPVVLSADETLENEVEVSKNTEDIEERINANEKTIADKMETEKKTIHLSKEENVVDEVSPTDENATLEDNLEKITEINEEKHADKIEEISNKQHIEGIEEIIVNKKDDKIEIERSTEVIEEIHTEENTDKTKKIDSEESASKIEIITEEKIQKINIEKNTISEDLEKKNKIDISENKNDAERTTTGEHVEKVKQLDTDENMEDKEEIIAEENIEKMDIEENLGQTKNEASTKNVKKADLNENINTLEKNKQELQETANSEIIDKNMEVDKDTTQCLDKEVENETIDTKTKDGSSTKIKPSERCDMKTSGKNTSKKKESAVEIYEQKLPESVASEIKVSENVDTEIKTDQISPNPSQDVIDYKQKSSTEGSKEIEDKKIDKKSQEISVDKTVTTTIKESVAVIADSVNEEKESVNPKNEEIRKIEAGNKKVDDEVISDEKVDQISATHGIECIKIQHKLESTKTDEKKKEVESLQSVSEEKKDEAVSGKTEKSNVSETAKKTKNPDISLVQTKTDESSSLEKSKSNENLIKAKKDIKIKVRSLTELSENKADLEKREKDIIQLDTNERLSENASKSKMEYKIVDNDQKMIESEKGMSKKTVKNTESHSVEISSNIETAVSDDKGNSKQSSKVSNKALKTSEKSIEVNHVTSENNVEKSALQELIKFTENNEKQQIKDSKKIEPRTIRVKDINQLKSQPIIEPVNEIRKINVETRSIKLAKEININSHETKKPTKVMQESLKSGSVFDKIKDDSVKLMLSKSSKNVQIELKSRVDSKTNERDSSDDDMMDSCDFGRGTDYNSDSNDEKREVPKKIIVNKNKSKDTEVKIQGTENKIVLKDINTLMKLKPEISITKVPAKKDPVLDKLESLTEISIKPRTSKPRACTVNKTETKLEVKKPEKKPPVLMCVDITKLQAKPQPPPPPVDIRKVAVKPIAMKPVAVKPVAIKPVAAKPVPVKPVAVKPVALKPVAVKPVPVKPVAVKPVAVKPVAVKPQPKLTRQTVANLRSKPLRPPPKIIIDDDDVIDVPETDPLAIAEEELIRSKNEEAKAPSLSLATFKLDDSADLNASLIPVPIARALRSRKIAAQPTFIPQKRGNDGPVEGHILKKTRSRGKGHPSKIDDFVIKIKDISSSEDENIVIPAEVKVTTPQRGTGKARRGRGRGLGRGGAFVERAVNDSPVISSDAQSETSRTEIDASPVEKVKPPSRKKKRVLGLDIDPAAIIEQHKDSDEPVTRSSVRQSRRIAQIKIKEEAERRKIDDFTHMGSKHKKKKKKSNDKDYKLEKKKKSYKELTEEDEVSEEDLPLDARIKRKKKRKHQDLRKLFNMSNPWQSSSESSTSNEEEEDEVEEEPTDEETAIVKSDHEFSPESDLENTEVQPLRRARTVKKESDTEDPTDEHACQKCGKADHPEWILLCDKCDCGWHCSCLRPALLVIPEGDWFCPPCQHISLVEALKVELVEYDKKMNRREMEVRRKQRLEYVGISLANVLATKESGEPNQEPENNEAIKTGSGDESSDSDSDSESGSSSGDESEPIYQLRQRRQAHSYRFNDYDELINSAIQDEIEAVKGAGNQGRGKDIATIVNAEKEESKSQSLLEQQKLEEPEVEPPPPVVPVYEEKHKPEREALEESSEDELPRVVPKSAGRKKHRKLNSLDISSEDDAADDEDFKGTSASEEEDLEDLGSEDSEEFELGRRGKGPTRRSTRARITRYDREFINDDSDEEPRKHKKSKSMWDESESEESDKSWGKIKRSKKQRQFSAPRTSKKSRKKKRRRNYDSDTDVKKPPKKKPRIQYGGLEDSEDEEFLARRTRGKKINYIDALGSDSEEEKVSKVRPIESEEEYVANDEEEEEEIGEAMDVIEDKEKESVDDKPAIPRKIIKIISPSKAARGRGKAGIPRPQQLKEDTPSPPPEEIEPEPAEEPREDVEPPEKPPEAIQEEEKALEPPPPVDIPVIAANPEDLNEDEVGNMMMENEEYAQKQLELMAVQLAKDKKKKEQENIKEILVKEQPVLPPMPVPVPVPTGPKKRGRKKKSEIEARLAAERAALQAQSAENMSESPEKLVLPNPSMSVSPGEIPASVPTVISDLSNSPPKRRGRGKGKKTLAAEAAASGELPQSRSEPSTAAVPTNPQNLNPMPNINIPSSTPPSDPQSLSPNPNLHGGKLGIAAPPQPFSKNQPTPSVITRMLQSQPMSAQTFTSSANAMNQKYFPPEQPPRGGQFPPIVGRSPYRQSSPMGMYSGVRQMAPRLRSPGPPNMQMFHSTHHSMDPSPSGGGPINITPNSPGTVPSKEGLTPPPPPYNRAINVSSPPQIRHMFPQPGGHLQQSSPPPRPPGGNFSPYHPPPPPNYHYGAYPPAPSLAAADDALPPTDYQGSPYPEHYNTAESTVHSSEGSNSKPFDEEGSGEFGGLVSYFSSQREDDLDT